MRNYWNVVIETNNGDVGIDTRLLNEDIINLVLPKHVNVSYELFKQTFNIGMYGSKFQGKLSDGSKIIITCDKSCMYFDNSLFKIQEYCLNHSFFGEAIQDIEIRKKVSKNNERRSVFKEENNMFQILKFFIELSKYIGKITAVNLSLNVPITYSELEENGITSKLSEYSYIKKFDGEEYYYKNSQNIETYIFISSSCDVSPVNGCVVKRYKLDDDITAEWILKIIKKCKCLSEFVKNN